MKRDSLIFYRSFYEAISELPKETQAELYDAIFQYSLNFKEVELSGVAKTVFTLIKPQLDANIKRYINGTKPKKDQEDSDDNADNKQVDSNLEAKDKQNGSKTEGNKNDNENKNPNPNENDNENEKPKKFNFKQSLLDLGVEPLVVSDWLIVRKNAGASNTETAFKIIKSEIEKTNASPNECILLAVERSWRGFKAEYYFSATKSNPTNNSIHGHLPQNIPSYGLLDYNLGMKIMPDGRQIPISYHCEWKDYFRFPKLRPRPQTYPLTPRNELQDFIVQQKLSVTKEEIDEVYNLPRK
jgi:hypothetical protein